MSNQIFFSKDGFEPSDWCRIWKSDSWPLGQEIFPGDRGEAAVQLAQQLVELGLAEFYLPPEEVTLLVANPASIVNSWLSGREEWAAVAAWLTRAVELGALVLLD